MALSRNHAVETGVLSRTAARFPLNSPGWSEARAQPGVGVDHGNLPQRGSPMHHDALGVRTTALRWRLYSRRLQGLHPWLFMGKPRCGSVSSALLRLILP